FVYKTKKSRDLAHVQMQVEDGRSVLAAQDHVRGACRRSYRRGRRVVDHVLVAAQRALGVGRQRGDRFVLLADRRRDGEVGARERHTHRDADADGKVEERHHDADRQHQEEPAAATEAAIPVAIADNFARLVVHVAASTMTRARRCREGGYEVRYALVVAGDVTLDQLELG